ncbi:lipoprotein [Latilactobacillus fuchuensis]|uniref:LptM family lipoprotein n=1 Tax=Latilactobacillus fuchuensis TaxID=164393 RepID=UPI0039AEF294
MKKVKRIFIPLTFMSLLLISLSACGQSEPLYSGLKKEYVVNKLNDNKIKFKVSSGSKVEVLRNDWDKSSNLSEILYEETPNSKGIVTLSLSANNQKIRIVNGDKTATKTIKIKESKKLQNENSNNNEENYSNANATESSASEQPSLSNDSIRSTIESADSGIDVESVNGSYTDADSTAQIVLNGRELASNKQAERAMLMDISTVWKTVKDNFDYLKISNIGVSVKYPLKDEGGNTSSEYVIKSDISGNKLDQLNSDGFNYKNVPNFATNWWQSEALPKL